MKLQRPLREDVRIGQDDCQQLSESDDDDYDDEDDDKDDLWER